MITIAEEKDAKKINKLIVQEFSYTDASEKKVVERIENPNYILFKYNKEKTFAGFAEIQLFPKNPLISRINGIAIEKKYRGKGFGKELLETCIYFLEHSGMEKIILLVGANNKIAKKLYAERGFEFRRLHKKRIAEKKIEEWEMSFPSNNAA